jgi:hypothetical protein
MDFLPWIIDLVEEENQWMIQHAFFHYPGMRCGLLRPVHAA